MSDIWSDATNLVPCSHCDNQLGPDATKCPRCGALTRAHRYRVMVTVWLLVLALAVGGGLFWLNKSNNEAEREAKREGERYAKCFVASLNKETCDP